MERKIASIRTIDDIKPIKGADRILLAVVGGWMTVIPIADLLSIGDHVVFVEIDGFVPTELAPFLTAPGHTPREYNSVSGERLKTRKFKGELSQGLIIPLQKCRHLIPDDVVIEDGLDVASYLNIQKWEPYISPQMQGVMKGNFPTHIIPKTDEDRCQSMNRSIFEHHANDTYEVSIKLDGSSITVYSHAGVGGICSRNVDFKLEGNDDNTFVSTARSTNLFDFVQTLNRNIAFQGELMGPSIQGNREELSEFRIFIYKIWDIDARRFLNAEERHDLIKAAQDYGAKIDSVPILFKDTSLQELGITDVFDLVKYASGPSLNAKYREGLVFKSNTDTSFSFKAISNEYLLRFEE